MSRPKNSRSLSPKTIPLKKKETVFALISALVGGVPIVAPMAGAQLLKWMSWRGAFVAFALIGLAIILFCPRFGETRNDRSTSKYKWDEGKPLIPCF